MKGYKVYYNGSKFTTKDELYEIEPDTDMVRYVGDYEFAIKLADKLNSKHKSWNELEDRYDYVVKICKDCSKPFMIRKSEIDWFKRKNAHFPVRCLKCRKHKKRKHFYDDF